MENFVLDFFTYNDEYDEENYEYDEDEDTSSEEEQAATFLPNFISSPTVFRVKEGHTARYIQATIMSEIYFHQ